MQQKQSQKKFFNIKKSYIVLVLISVLCFACLVYLDHTLRISEIKINGVSKKTSLNGVHGAYNSNLFFFDTDELESTIVAYNPVVKKATIKKVYPNSLQVAIVTHQPMVNFMVDQGFFVLSEDGTILEKAKEGLKELPEVRYYQKLHYSAWHSGDSIEYKDVISALHFLRTSLDLGLTIDTIDINGLNMIALLLQDRKIVFTTEKDQALQDYQLETIIKQFKVEGKDFSVLDLRFDKPVIQIKTQ